MEKVARTLGTFATRRSTDEDIFARAMRGDAVAFSEVYRRYEKRVYAFCLARSLDREAAADATQEVFVRLLKSDPGSIDHPRAWLFTVARNVSIDALRKRVRMRESGEVDEDAPAWESMAAADTADAVTARSDARAVFLALRRLNPRYRTALILREIHGQSSADIAEAMEVATTGAVDTLVSRARDAFGVAYAAIAELPQACRHSVELMYRSRGTGIDPQESDALKAHLAACERCRREDARADDPKRFPALLPLMVPAGAAAHGLLGRAAIASGDQTGVSIIQKLAEFWQSHLHTIGARVATGALAATLVAAPVVAVNVTHTSTPPSIASVSHVRAGRARALSAAVDRDSGRIAMGSARAVVGRTQARHTGTVAQVRGSDLMRGRTGTPVPSASRTPMASPRTTGPRTGGGARMTPTSPESPTSMVMSTADATRRKTGTGRSGTSARAGQTSPNGL